MKKLSAFFVFTVILAVAYSAPLSSENAMNHLLLIRENLLAAEANQQEMMNTLPWPPHLSLPSYISFPYSEEKTSEYDDDEDMLLKVRDSLNVGRARYLFSKILEKILQDEPWLWAKSIKTFHTSDGEDYVITRQSEKNGAKISSMADGGREIRVQAKQKEQKNEALFTRLLACLVNRTQDLAESLKKFKIFGIPHNRALEAFQNLLLGKNTFSSYFKTFLSIFLKPESFHASEELGKEQVMNDVFTWEFFKHLYIDVFEAIYKFAKPKPGEDEGLYRFLRNFLNIVRLSLLNSMKKLNAEDKTSYDNSINYFLDNYFFKQIDRMDENDAVKNAMKKAIKDALYNLIPVFFQLDSKKRVFSPEERNTLLRSFITVLASFNFKATDNNPLLLYVHQFLSRNPDNEELSIKLQLLFILSSGMHSKLCSGNWKVMIKSYVN